MAIARQGALPVVASVVGSIFLRVRHSQKCLSPGIADLWIARKLGITPLPLQYGGAICEGLQSVLHSASSNVNYHSGTIPMHPD